MSLNWREINLALSELELAGSQVQKVVQPAYDTLVLSLYLRGKTVELLVCVAHGACRVHATGYPVPKPEKPLRSAELLRSHLRGARLVEVGQLGAERIVRFRFERSDGERLLYARLWSGAANIILTDPEGVIFDALARKPSRGELAGGVYRPGAGEPPTRNFEPRDFPGEGGFNERVDRFYAERGSELSLEAQREKAAKWFAWRRGAVEARMAELERKASEYSDPERFREIGDLLMANPSAAPDAQGMVRLEDFHRGGEALVRVDRKLDAVGNARAYYERHRKAKSGWVETRDELALAKASLDELAREEDSVRAMRNPHEVRAFLSRRKAPQASEERRFPGLSLEISGWLVLIGRSAAENDALLRRHVRGNDLWLHARDYAGAYVFVKGRPGKSVPLPVMLDAGCLALYYSKARSSGGGDLYYTLVKYLRRAKDGPKGLVIPTQEKNLRVRIDETRLRELRRLLGHDADD